MEQILGLQKGWRGQRGHKKSLAITSSWWDVGNRAARGGLRINIYVEHGLATLLVDTHRLVEQCTCCLLSALSQRTINRVHILSDTTTKCSKIRASGLLVKFNVAIVEPRVRFSAGAFLFVLASGELLWCCYGLL